MKFQELRDAGLTLTEARAYVALLELGDAKASALSARSRVPTSNLYAALHSLQEKGLVSFRLQNNMKNYVPSTPDALEQLFEDRKNALEEKKGALLKTIARLKRAKRPVEEHPQFRYFESQSGVKSLWLELIDGMGPNELHRIHVGKPEGYRRLRGFYDQYHEQRRKRAIPCRMIFSPRDKGLAATRKSKNLEIRFDNTNSLAEWGVIGEKFFFQHIQGKKPKAFLVEDPVFVQAFAEMFDRQWDALR